MRASCSLIRPSFCFLIAFGPVATLIADDAPPAEIEVTQSIDGEPLDPQGRFSDNLTRQTPRYYVWRDTEGWHLRSASQRGRLVRFHGSIVLTGGTFNKLRPVGLETRGSAADSWQVAEDRSRVDFEIKTTSSFDGFDFTINDRDAFITFDLSMGNRKFLKRIYIGSDGQHPAKAEFTLPASRSSE